MKEGPKYVATELLPTIFGVPAAWGRMSERATPRMYCVAAWPSKTFLKYVGKE